MRDPVRHVAEQELRASAHARVADDQHVRVLLLGRAHDRAGDVRVDAKHGSCSVEGACVLLQTLLRSFLRLEEDLEQDELGAEAARQLRGPLDGLPGRLGAIRRDHDFHVREPIAAALDRH